MSMPINAKDNELTCTKTHRFNRREACWKLLSTGFSSMFVCVYKHMPIDLYETIMLQNIGDFHTLQLLQWIFPKHFPFTHFNHTSTLPLCTLLVTREFYDDTFYVSFTTINCIFNRVYVNAFAIEIAIGQMKTYSSVLYLLAESWFPPSFLCTIFSSFPIVSPLLC